MSKSQACSTLKIQAPLQMTQGCFFVSGYMDAQHPEWVLRVADPEWVQGESLLESEAKPQPVGRPASGRSQTYPHQIFAQVRVANQASCYPPSLIRHRLTAPHPFGARRFAPVQTALQPSAVLATPTFFGRQPALVYRRKRVSVKTVLTPTLLP